jgi:hypothetical protein
MGARAPAEAGNPTSQVLCACWLNDPGRGAEAEGVLNRRSESRRIAARWGRLLVDAPTGLARADEEIGVASFDALALLAEERGATIAHLPDPWTGGDVYFFDDGGTRYRYRAAARHSERRPVAI